MPACNTPRAASTPYWYGIANAKGASVMPGGDLAKHTSARASALLQLPKADRHRLLDQAIEPKCFEIACMTT